MSEVSEVLASDRRTFMRRGAMGAGALWMFSLPEFGARRAHGQTGSPSPYGPISPKLDETTGLPLIQLPDGFRYLTYSWTGDRMSDGVLCPNLHDGMAVIDELSQSMAGLPAKPGDAADDCCARLQYLVLVRNHEGGGGVPYTNNPGITYLNDASGGTTNLVFDAGRGRWLKSLSSLAGTWRNCAGGVTPWGTWLTCEEVGNLPNHGWMFEVNALRGNPKPLKAMGRFSHEACMVDPRTGYVYETEDEGNSGFYRFVPNARARMADGGTLEMLRIKGQPNLDLGQFYPAGTVWDVEWVCIDDPEALATRTYTQGANKGGARFARLEGAWWGGHTGYFLSTSGGSVGEGQVFEYDPRTETLTLLYDAPNANALDNPDNMTVSPRGGLLLCEDAAGNQFTEGERMIGLKEDGTTFTFAQNNIVLTSAYNPSVPAGDYRQQEWAGACYSPDGKWLFANIQTPGLTFAITGPWGSGPL